MGEPLTIQVGWLLTGELDPVAEEAIRLARDRALVELPKLLPGLAWEMPLRAGSVSPGTLRVEPAKLLQFGSRERDTNHWDITLVLTDVDLIAYRRPFTFVAPSTALAVGALSTARLDPRIRGRDATREERVEVLTHRVYGLALYLIARLALGGGDVAEQLPDPNDLAALDGFRSPDPARVAVLGASLRRMAAPRLEEKHRPGGRLRFALATAVRNRKAILTSVARARPWNFPLELRRLAIASFSTLVVLMMTAESWDLALTRSWGELTRLSVGAWLAVCWFLVAHPAVRHGGADGAPTEQVMQGRITAALVIAVGMLTTYALAFVLAAGTGFLLIAPSVVDSWSAVQGYSGPGDYFQLAAFVAAIGILTGALGASLEDRDFLFHVAYIDQAG